MDLDSIRKATAEAIGVDVSELDYITEELVAELKEASDEGDDTSDLEEDEVMTESGIQKLAGVYCNSLTYDAGSGGYIRYKRGKKGTANYGCGTTGYKKGKSGTSVKTIGSCSGGRTKYLVSW